MQDQRLREMMAKLYRLVEEYENPPRLKYTDEANEYFLNAANKCTKLFNQYDNVYAREFVLAFYKALGEVFKQKNPNGTVDRENKVSV